MCMFQYKNTSSPKAYQKGVEYFECGACPECMQKKSRKWALRCGMQARVSPGVMVTLTYDTYKYGSDKHSFEESPPDPSIPLSKEHCQKFIKRLRKWLSKRTNKKLLYILTAERGKRTNRAHYHALLFNVTFDDLVKYKKSGRGNIIYKSKTLEKLWSHGICTVDCINLSAKTARYCTKYCAKDSGADDTFMLFSRGIGDEELLKRFNGKSYWVDGREYSIPREIWQKYIERKYNIKGYSRYKGIKHLYDTEKKLSNFFDKNGYNDKFMRVELNKLENSPIAYQRQLTRREIYYFYRDNDHLYKRYLAYWKRKNEINNITRPSEIQRILALPDLKYWSYKQKALQSKGMQAKRLAFIPPRSKCHGFDKEGFILPKKEHVEKSFAPLTRHYTANDTNWKELNRLRRCFMELTATECEYNPFVL